MTHSFTCEATAFEHDTERSKNAAVGACASALRRLKVAVLRVRQCLKRRAAGGCGGVCRA